MLVDPFEFEIVVIRTDHFDKFLRLALGIENKRVRHQVLKWALVGEIFSVPVLHLGVLSRNGKEDLRYSEVVTCLKGLRELTDASDPVNVISFPSSHDDGCVDSREPSPAATSLIQNLLKTHAKPLTAEEREAITSSRPTVEQRFRISGK